MEINEKKWAEQQYEILVRFIYHLAYYRILSKEYSNCNEKSEFWKYTIDAHLIRAIIDWCMVFGTDSNELHWKKIILSVELQDSFRRTFLNDLSISNKGWKSYHQEMLAFRNNYVAHKNSDVSPAPFMDKALQVVTTYDIWFRKNLLNTIFNEPLLQTRYSRIIRTSSEPLSRAIKQGPNINQEYEKNTEQKNPE